MKKILFISALLILATTSCKKEPTSANIKSVTVTDFPNNDGANQWDAGSDADLYIKIAINQVVVWDAPTYYTDVLNTSSLSFTPSSAVAVTDLTQDVQIDFYDYEDGITDQWMGGVIFQLEDYKNDAPSSKDLTSGTFSITLSLDWITG
jgi:hypothetical protein